MSNFDTLNNEIENMEDLKFLEFYNKVKENKLLKNIYTLSEPNIKEKIFMIDFKKKSEDLVIYDIHDQMNNNIFYYTTLSISYYETYIELNNLTLFNGNFFMEELNDILKSKKIYINKEENEDILIKEIIKIFKVIEYLDYLVTYCSGKKTIDWNEWKDWNDYNL